ncbi:hypothetical protein ASPCADRAFT_401539 [Aspergillus carbonarius ITEM 5010]|uniref:PPPDE domain-containing protein n=1 Tax=Aspergillus carbonarius (strain ITEM 5010) TaxID=602072 RepID=A0A1R3S1I4_ASPC5|nr:hypothetical protein ASPCADRAFT_401539 [Aspergillus carbonarius ITEM 5010]
MSSMADVYVVIYRNRGLYNHWSLFIDGPTEEEKLILHIVGSSTRYRFEVRDSNAHKSGSLIEKIELCQVDASKTADIHRIAEQQTIHNEAPGFNCQDYVLELLGSLENSGIIDETDPEYMKQKEIVKSKQEGLP